jgi:predicted alpha/beta hydrolase family esterase/tetratricopeptide (TPR) repeat protein
MELMTRLLVLFVHGMGGSEETWGRFRNLIEDDLELKKVVQVEFFSYPTGTLRWFNRWRYLELEDLSEALGTAVNNRFGSFERIILVCHSMGGLLCKKYVAQTVAQNDTFRIAGILFFATPHTGAELAGVSDMLSREHAHAKQVRPNSVFLEQLNRDWINLRCETKLDTTYVIAGQDSIVDKTSAGGPPGSRRELIPDRGHIDVVKPNNSNELAFLILKTTVRRILNEQHPDLAAATTALQNNDSHALESLIASRGRSWIETTSADRGIELLEEVVAKFHPTSAEVIWSRYLLIIARLFRFRDTSSSAVDDDLVKNSDQFHLTPLLLAEKMELARKRGDKQQAIDLAATVLKIIKERDQARGAGEAYAIGTAYFLLGNLFRDGGQYREAKSFVERAQTFFRPGILAHQIELAHCQYALEICRAVLGGARLEVPMTVGSSEFRPFAEALLTLTRSHAEWCAARVPEAANLADFASQAFEKIGYRPYADRANRLKNLLQAWHLLELGAATEKAISVAPDDANVLRAMLGSSDSSGTVKDKISKMRVSHAVGLLQFAATYNPDWTNEIGEFELPPTIAISESGISWQRFSASSLAGADRTLRSQVGITSNVLLPLMAD